MPKSTNQTYKAYQLLQVFLITYQIVFNLSEIPT